MVRALPKRNPDQFFFVSLIILKILPPCVLISNALTYICRSFGYGEVGAHTPGSSMVVLLATAAVWPRGIVLALAAQLPLVEHAAVGVQVALAPETEKTDDGDMNRHHSVSAESIPSGVNSQFFFHPHCVYLRFWIFIFFHLFFYTAWLKSRRVIWLEAVPPQSFIMLAFKKTRPHLYLPLRRERRMWMKALWEPKERHSVRFTNWGQNRDLIEMMAQREKQHSMRILFLLPSKLLCYAVREPSGWKPDWSTERLY